MNLVNLRTRMFGTPLAIHPSKFEIIIGAIGDRLGIDVETLEENLKTDARAEALKLEAAVPDKSFQITQEGIAIVPIQGTLMRKTSGLMAMSGCTSYETLQRQLDQALN